MLLPKTPAPKKIALTEQGLARRVKRFFNNATREYLAVTTPGFEEILESELRMLPDVTIKDRFPGGVEFYGPITAMYHANLRLATASRVLMRIDSFVACSLPELYQKSRKIHWEVFSGFHKSLAFQATAASSRLHHTDNIIETVMSGISARMKDLKVPVQKVEDSPITFHIRFVHDRCTISIDTSGELLYKRGYRTDIGHAPLRENITAALLRTMKVEDFPVIADPMCGSGTFLVEAAQALALAAPGKMRHFAFESWPVFNPALFSRIKSNCTELERMVAARIVGSDVSPSALKAAEQNLVRAGLTSAVRVTEANCLDFNKNSEHGHRGLIISNFPYGKRAFVTQDPLAFCADYGAHLKKVCKGWSFGFLLGDRAHIKALGLRTTKEISFMNGGLDVVFVCGVL